MKNLKVLAMALFAALTFAACENEDGPDDPFCPGSGPDPVLSSEVYILNNGNWGANDANFLSYNLDTKVATPHFFQKANGVGLGDLGQDIVALENGDFFIAVNGSQVVFVTDHSLRVKQMVIADIRGEKLSPRYFAVGGDKVYVTYYEGYLGEISLRDYSVRTTPVGPSPEGLAYVDGRIYVANSGGAFYPDYAKTISVVDAKSFKEVEQIEVNLNPQMVVASSDGAALYVNSFGNYESDPEKFVPAKLQRISVSNGEVTDLDYTDVKAICAGPADVLYVATGAYNDLWQVTGYVNRHDMKTDSKQGLLFADPILNFYSLSYSQGFVFVGASDYKTNGDVYIYDEQGKLLDQFDAQGLNPQKGVRL